MLFKFVGQYTNGHTSITMYGVTFNGDEPAEVTDPTACASLAASVGEFEAVEAENPPAEQQEAAEPTADTPKPKKPRGRRKKAAA